MLLDDMCSVQTRFLKPKMEMLYVIQLSDRVYNVTFPA